MAESRTRERFFASHPDLFRSVVEVDPRTTVPKPSPCEANGPGNLPHRDEGPVLCVLSSCTAPVAADPDLHLLRATTQLAESFRSLPLC